jgi:ATP-dependent Clp protease ATP-binding subunit ClpC
VVFEVEPLYLVLLGVVLVDRLFVEHRVSSAPPIALQEMGVTGDQVRDALVAIVPPGAAEVVGDPPFTPRSVRALELALSSALELGHNYIGTEHMLLGILRERDGLAAQILAARGVDEERAKARVIELLSGHPAP